MDIQQGELIDTYGRSHDADTRRKAAKFGAMGSTIRATKPMHTWEVRDGNDSNRD